MKKLWVFGDSYTAEYYPVGEVFVVSNYDKYKEYRGGNLPDVWPTILGKKLGLEVENLAVGGSANTNIFLAFLYVCDKLQENDRVIIGWSNNKRFVAANFKDNNLNNILPCDSDFPDTLLSKNTIDEIFYNRTHPVWYKEIYGWIKIINLYCDLKKVKVHHWTSDYDMSAEFNKMDNEKFISVLDSKNRGLGLMERISEINYEKNGTHARIVHETNFVVEDGHFGEFGHIAQADFFYNFIKKHE
tara:strand:- start:3678 stop:4409 length:732 start_codon:yes stop_codon:yes gene_type:complete